MGLTEYKAKRDFRQTAEPAGRSHAAPKTSRVLFVVQKHAASRLHYDFRLEMEGVLKSWAVPKGFPVKRGDRRLAVEVEDHPLEYGRFEGTIPEGNYGAGTVMVWDIGTYRLSGDDPLEALENGKIHVALEGKKLRGDWTLVRMRRFQGKKPQWLLLKSGSDSAPLSARAEDRSALTGRSMKQIAGGNTQERAVHRGDIPVLRRKRAQKRGMPHSTDFKQPRSRRWHTRQKALEEERSESAGSGSASLSAKSDLKRLAARKPEFVEPMKALQKI